MDNDESLAAAVCCDSRMHIFAEPRFLYAFPNVNLYSEMNSNGTTIFYDPVCGIPLFEAPKGRTFEEFQADTDEHGWPSFRQDEVITENVEDADDDGTVSSKCGTHLGTYLPDDKGPRWCIDLSCVSGQAADEEIDAARM